MSESHEPSANSGQDPAAFPWMPAEPPWSPSPAAEPSPADAAPWDQSPAGATPGGPAAPWDQSPAGAALGGPAAPWGPPPGGGAPGGPYGAWGPPPQPASGSGPPLRSGKGVRLAAAVGAVTVMVASLGLGIGIGTHLRSTNASSSATASIPATPSNPSTGLLPTPSFGSGSTGSSGSGVSSQATAIAAKVDPAIVDIDTKLGYQSAEAAGTGMVLTANGEILTNNHVVDGATTITATLVTTGRTYTAKVIGTDPTADIAILQLQGASSLKTISTAGTPAQGDTVIAIGNAGGAGGTPSVVTGTVQALNQTITASDQNGANAEQLSDLIQTDAPIQPGDSGGPLVNTSGRVVGIDTAASGGNRLNSAASVGFAIPISDALSVAKQIEAGKATTTVHIGLPAFLGVAVAADGTTGGSGGAVIASVASGTPAEAAGLTQGDTITALGNKSVDSAQTLTTLTQSHHPGDKVTVAWTDQSGASHTATVTLGAGPAD